jgi:hypothetical protein
MNAVIDVGHHQVKPMAVASASQQIEQHDRIRPTGNGYQGPTRGEVEAGDMLAKPFAEGHDES